MSVLLEPNTGFILIQDNYGIIAIGKMRNNNGKYILLSLTENDELTAENMGLGFSVPCGAPVTM